MDPILDELSRVSDSKVSEFERLLHQAAKDDFNFRRTAPSDEPLTWVKDRNKLVRLDHAILACHIMVARVAFRSIPAMTRQRIFDFKVGLAKTIAFAILKKLAGAALKLPRRLFDEVTGFLKADAIELESEQAIRRQSIRVMRDLRKQILFQGTSTSPRKTKLVFTRHETAPQRRPNRHWRSPKGTKQGRGILGFFGK